MQLTYNDWSLSLNLNGGRIKELLLKGVRVFGTYQRIDGKEGNTHMCAPSFDKEGQEKYNLPFHGYARTLTWHITQQTNNTLQMRVVTPSSKTYPTELELTQEFLLNNIFTHSITIKHLKGPEVPVNCAIHYYWDTPLGWSELQINSQNQKKAIETNGYINLQKKNLLIFPHASYEMNSNGFYNAALWTSFKEDGKKQYSQNFCCIEPVIGWPGYFGTDKSILRPGTTISASIQLKKVV